MIYDLKQNLVFGQVQPSVVVKHQVALHELGPVRMGFEVTHWLARDLVAHRDDVHTEFEVDTLSPVAELPHPALL